MAIFCISFFWLLLITVQSLDASSVNTTTMAEQLSVANLSVTPNFENPNDNVTFSGNSSILIKGRPVFSFGTRSLGRRNKKYIISEFKASWLRAMQYCRSQDMQLVELNSRTDQKVLEKVLKTNKVKTPVWTSGSDNSGDLSFFWISSGKEVSYKNWRRGQPDGLSREGNLGTDHCLQVSSEDSYQWSDFTCFTKQYFICEED